MTIVLRGGIHDGEVHEVSDQTKHVYLHHGVYGVTPQSDAGGRRIFVYLGVQLPTPGP
jgi:hypothetical protein